MKQSLRALMERLIDYAGLFPPAALSMQDAVRNYARYREGEDEWALGKFVVPMERAREVPPEFPLAILHGGGQAILPVETGQGTGQAGLPVLHSLEVKATTEEEIAAFPPGVYVEIADLRLLDAIAKHGLRAKIRTGGITADAFPAIGNIAAFLRACKEKGVAFKATAGLHHPLRCVKPLTYEPNAPLGTMHGFLNVFIAAAMLEHADAILAEEDPAAFAFEDDALSWRGHRVSTEEIAWTRRTFATSFGSCSFEEPIGDLREWGWMP